MHANKNSSINCTDQSHVDSSVDKVLDKGYNKPKKTIDTSDPSSGKTTRKISYINVFILNREARGNTPKFGSIRSSVKTSQDLAAEKIIRSSSERREYK